MFLGFKLMRVSQDLESKWYQLVFLRKSPLSNLPSLRIEIICKQNFNTPEEKVTFFFFRITVFYRDSNFKCNSSKWILMFFINCIVYFLLALIFNGWGEFGTI